MHENEIRQNDIGLERGTTNHKVVVRRVLFLLVSNKPVQVYQNG